MPPDKTTHYYNPPPTREEKFLAGLDKAIEFNRTNQTDPHGIGNAVIASLFSVREAFAEAYGLPRLCKPKTTA